ncbi:ribulose-phosphate 3-epimerase, partial [Alphaproteobacteria bacterium]|nr:ribulose-phosphate 3-epimerase [Alphaproteobacteria bacterium]
MSHTSPLAPSLLSADFSCLMDQLNTLSEAGVTRLHVDVMDGHFVPNLSFGAPVLAKLPQDGRFFYDVHLMVEGPALTIDPYVKAGAGALTFHVEAVDDPLPFIREIKAAGCQAGLSLRPGTAVERLFPYLDSLDLVLVMTVEPG